MKAQTFGWLVFLALFKSFSLTGVLFTLEGTGKVQRATERSCVDLKCKVTSPDNVGGKGHWIWMKDPKWSPEFRKFQGTVVYSSNGAYDVSEDYKDRVTYIGSPPNTWAASVAREEVPLCSILICDLKKSDSGMYALRFFHNTDESKHWLTENQLNLTVEENPCPITFDVPQVAVEHTEITLTCSTSTSCESAPQISALSHQLGSNGKATNLKSMTHTFTAGWEDDGKVFSCQMRGNTDQYLMRNVTVGVEYAPRDVLFRTSSSSVNEGDSVTLSCSAKGRPEPTFTWYKGDQFYSIEAKKTIVSIREANSGSYHCIAKNKHSETSSERVNIEVNYAPEVEVWISQESGWIFEPVAEGAKVTFECNVKRSKPLPHKLVWFKDDNRIGGTWDNKNRHILSVQPNDSGNYACEATNSVGSGKSKVRRLQVKYKPRNTRISAQQIYNNRVSIKSRHKMTCETDAYPAPWFSWYKQMDASRRTFMGGQRDLILESVERAQEGCYTCQARNSIGAETSEPQCIQVQYPPQNVELSLTSQVAEGQLVTISCTADSFPPSTFTLTRSSKRPSAGWSVTPRLEGKNSARYSFTAASTDADYYTCNAKNDLGTSESAARKLMVKYAPKEVKVKSRSDLVVEESKSFRLDCVADAHPPVTSVTWTKVTDEDHEAVLGTDWYLEVESVGPSDSGWYRCKATNEFGTGQSQQVHVKVKYGPKDAKVLRREKQQLSDGTSVVVLSCITHCYPPATQYAWYKRTSEQAEDVMVSDGQNITVSCHEPGEYYCTVKNEMGLRASDPVTVLDKEMKTFVLIIILCLVLFIAVLIFVVYRCRRNKSTQERTANTRPSDGFMGIRNRSRRGNLMTEAASAEPFRSQDDLLLNHCQPDSMPTTSNVTSVYSTVNLPKGKQTHSATPVEEDSVNYASLNFGNKQKKPEEETVYAKVSKPHPNTPRKEQRKNREDYENGARAAGASRADDTDTSEDDLEVSYSQVTFKLKEVKQRAKRDSDTTEEETQYSEVKI